MAAGMRAGAAGIPHLLGQGCPLPDPQVLCGLPTHPYSSCPLHLVLPQQQQQQGANAAFHSLMGLQSLSNGLFWVYCDLRGGRECLQHLLHHICWGCWRWVAGAVAAPWERLQRDCVAGKGCEEHRANPGTPRVMLEAKVPSKRPQDGDRVSGKQGNIVFLPPAIQQSKDMNCQRKFDDSTYNFKFWPSLHFFLLQPLLVSNLLWMYLCTSVGPPVLPVWTEYLWVLSLRLCHTIGSCWTLSWCKGPDGLSVPSRQQVVIL